MRIAILAMGTRGDVQPYVALGKGLQEAGHAVRLVTHPNFAALVNAHGLSFYPVSGNVQDVAESEEMRVLLEKGNFLAITRKTAQEAQRAAVAWAAEGLAACSDVGLIVAGIGGLYLGIALAEKLNLPLVEAYVAPFTPTNAFPGVVLPRTVSRLGGAANRFSHHLVRQMMWQGFRTADKQVRQKVLDLPAAPFWGPYDAGRLRPAPVLYGFSPSVIAKPPDWGANTHVTGYWFLESAAVWTPPDALEAFLQDGPTPVYVGFGSMSNRRPEEMAALILQALEQSQQRAILMAGWGGLRQAALPDTVLMVDSIPHAWLFPRVAAVVHHGGAGTTAAGLRAGVPSIIVPFFGDQAFWGERVAALGVGPNPIPRKQLTAERLAQALQQAVHNQTMRRRAADLGERIRAEDGVANAVAVVAQVEARSDGDA